MKKGFLCLAAFMVFASGSIDSRTRNTPKRLSITEVNRTVDSFSVSLDRLHVRMEQLNKALK